MPTFPRNALCLILGSITASTLFADPFDRVICICPTSIGTLFTFAWSAHITTRSSQIYEPLRTYS